MTRIQSEGRLPIGEDEDILRLSDPPYYSLPQSMDT